MKGPDYFQPGVIFRVRGIGPWQQHSGLDVHQCGSHNQIFSGHNDVQSGLHKFQIFQVLGGHQGYGDICDLKSVLADQVEKQIQRPLKGLQLYLAFRLQSVLRTWDIVDRATFLALSAPSVRMAFTLL